MLDTNQKDSYRSERWILNELPYIRGTESDTSGCMMQQLRRERWTYILMNLGQWFDILKKEKKFHTPIPRGPIWKSRGLQCDMLNVCEKWQTIFTVCSKGPALSLPDISPSHLIDKLFSAAHTLILLLDHGWQVYGLYPNMKQPFNPSSMWGCSQWRGWFIRLIQRWWSE